MLSVLIFGVVLNLASEPMLWMRPDGAVTVQGQTIRAQFSPGTRRMNTPRGWGYDFSGPKSGILLPDLPELALSHSMTVAAWIRPRAYVTDGPGAQILFRGDDRSGLDPYDLVIHPDGTIWFAIQNDREQWAAVGAELPLGQWTHVCASYDESGGPTKRVLRMWIDGKLVAMSTTSRAPLSNLDKRWTPGLGIGNVQNDRGPHNQPFNGTLFDLRLYDVVLEPDETGYQGALGEPPL